jgi:hypothetical protein
MMSRPYYRSQAIALVAASVVVSLAAAQSTESRSREQSGSRPGEVITPPERRARPADSLKVGDPAPDFTLPDLSGKKQVTLSQFQGQKPVVLVFGSYT